MSQFPLDAKLTTGTLPPVVANAAWHSVVAGQIPAHALEAGWLSAAICDGARDPIQAIGLRKGWLAHVAR